MKNFILILCALFALTSAAIAQEDTQTANVEKSGVVFKIQKQPQESPSKQDINVSKSGLVVIVQIGGKRQNLPDIEGLKK